MSIAPHFSQEAEQGGAALRLAWRGVVRLLIGLLSVQPRLTAGVGVTGLNYTLKLIERNDLFASVPPV